MGSRQPPRRAPPQPRAEKINEDDGGGCDLMRGGEAGIQPGPELHGALQAFGSKGNALSKAEGSEPPRCGVPAGGPAGNQGLCGGHSAGGLPVPFS